MRFDVVSLFAPMFDAILDYGVTSRALDAGLIEAGFHDPRDFTHDKHRSVDDRPYGGGPGMVMRPGPLVDAIEAAKAAQPAGSSVVYLSPQGRVMDDALVAELALRPGLVLVCGRYEGIDERVIETVVDEEVSIGDYVHAGGELAAMVLMEAVIRRLPGALGNAASAVEDSFADGLLDHPHYTRPDEFRGLGVPEVLLSGDHEAIRVWRAQQALARTRDRRPDLLSAERSKFEAESSSEEANGPPVSGTGGQK